MSSVSPLASTCRKVCVPCVDPTPRTSVRSHQIRLTLKTSAFALFDFFACTEPFNNINPPIPSRHMLDIFFLNHDSGSLNQALLES